MTQPTLPTLPPIHNYWVIAHSKRGERSPRKIFSAIGGALVTWELFEESLADLFTIFVRCPTGAAARAYGSVLTSKGRCDMLIAAAEIYFPMWKKKDESAKAFFALLMRHCAKASPIRNQIAHGVTKAMVISSSRVRRDRKMGKTKSRSHGFFLVPPSHATNKRPAFTKFDDWWDEYAFMRWKYRYTSADITAFGSKFEMLGDTSRRFVEYLDPSGVFRVD